MKTLQEIIVRVPGAYLRRQEIILAICRGVGYNKQPPDDIGKWIVQVANAITVRTENK